MRLPQLFLFCVLVIWFPVQYHAQVQDDFSDGDFTLNPTWTGEDSLFLVNGQQALQTDGRAQNDVIYLSTPNQRVAQTEWRIRVRYPFAPSNSNNVRIYLVSDTDSLEGPVNGYYLQLGESGNSDGIDLYRQTGTQDSLLIDGPDSTIRTRIDILVQVIRDGQGNWTVSADFGSGMFELQGTSIDTRHTTSRHLGVWVRHSSTRGASFFFDDVYAGSIIRDTLPPELIQTEVVSSTELRVSFDERLATAPAETPTNYQLAPGNLSPSTAQLDAADSTKVLLTFANPLVNNTQYILSINQLADRNGNVLPTTVTDTFFYFLPDVPAPGEVIIHEIFPDPTPTVGLPDAEYIELRNISTKTFDLEDWTLSNGTTVGRFPPYILGPDEYVIVADRSDTAALSAFGPVTALSSWTSLVNSGDNLGLRSLAGVLLDTVDYDISWYRDPAKDDGGFALELIETGNTGCPVAESWIASIDPSGGTPGGPNSVINLMDTLAPQVESVELLPNDSLRVCFSETPDTASAAVLSNYSVDNGLGNPQGIRQEGNCVLLGFSDPIIAGQLYTVEVTNIEDCRGNVSATPFQGSFLRGAIPQPGEVVINEIFADPSPPVGLPEAEFLELHNPTTKFFNLNTWNIDNGTTVGTLPNVILAPGDYVILCSSGDSVDFAAFGRVILPSSWPSLVNGGDELVLRDRQNIPIDEVAYELSWYRDEVKDDGGFSLERINPNAIICPDFTNWSATEDLVGGTPGRENSIFSIDPDTTAPSLVSVEAIAPDTLRICFSQSMDIAALENAANYSVTQGIDNPILAEGDRPNYECVWLYFDQPRVPGTAYELTISNLLNCKGIPLTPQTVALLEGEAGAPFDLVINEFMADPEPAVGLPEAEFVELYNRSSKLIQLENYTFQDGSNSAAFPAYVISPNEYVILCRETDTALFSSFGNVLGIDLPGLNNTGERLELRNAAGDLIDYVAYTDDWYANEDKAEGGWTLERVDPNFVDCNQPANWRAAENIVGGTPGAENSIRSTFEDTMPPEVIGLAINGPQSIEIRLSEQMDLATLTDTNRYQLLLTPGRPSLAFAVEPEREVVELLFEELLEENTLYTLSIEGVEDCAGNPLTQELAIGIPQNPAPGDVLINEILFNPFTGGSDFVEIYNASDKVLDLEDLNIGEIFPDTDSIFNDDPVAARSVLFLPGELICLTRDVEFQQAVYLPPSFAKFQEMEAFPSYDDGEGECVIFSDSGVVLDQFFYLDDYHYPTLVDDDGVSLERISFNVPTQNTDNWHSAAGTVGFATPGYPNSQAQEIDPGDTEVSLDPVTFSPDDDGQDDVLAINYDFDFTGANARISIHDAQGRLIKVLQQNQLLGTEAGTFFWDGRDGKNTKADIGMYVVLFEVTRQDTGEREVYRRVCVLAGRL
ncbi:MAG: lamin tail domain-containing protein [Bacteroidota bacterium]